MTTPNYPGSPTSTGVPTDAGTTADSGAKEQARQTAGTAAEESKHVAGVAKDEAQTVAAEAMQQARGLMDEARTQVDEQSRTQRDRVVNTLRTFSDDLEQMASQGGRTGMATDMARQVASKTRDLSTHLDGREPSDLLEDVRDFARRKPGVFLFGAVAAGVLAGRLTRGAKAASSQSGTTHRSVYDDPRGTASGYPTAGTGYPATEPAYTATDPAYPATDPAYPSGVSGVAPQGTTGDPLDPQRRGTA